MQNTPLVSVVIPTHNRFDALTRTLFALNEQTIPSDQFEVILVDDGSQDPVETVIDSKNLDFPILLLKQKQLGPASARNRGAQHAKGQILLFLDNDMIADPDLVLEHLNLHSIHPRSLVVGLRSKFNHPDTSDPLDVFDYRPDGSDWRLDKQPLSFQEAFTCNLSIRNEDWRELDGFNEDFQMNSFEDIEFAYRAVKNGLQIRLAEKALAHHNHTQSFQDRCRRTLSYTRTVPLLIRLHPELRGEINHLRDKEPVNWRTDSPRLIIRKFIRQALALRPVLESMEAIVRILQRIHLTNRVLDFFYWKVVGSYQWIGLREGIRKYGWNDQ